MDVKEDSLQRIQIGGMKWYHMLSLSPEKASAFRMKCQG